MSVPLAVLKLKTGAFPPPTSTATSKNKPGLNIGLDRVSSCLADRAVVTELIITGSTGIVEPRVAQAEGL